VARSFRRRKVLLASNPLAVDRLCLHVVQHLFEALAYS
jgi:hypothetical protein